jgi:hypothetical protein
MRASIQRYETWLQRRTNTHESQNKRVAVIGAGSSGIQIVPSLQKEPGAHIDHYVRGPTWISTTLAGEEVQQRGGESNFEYRPEEIEEWRKNPELYLAYRRKIEADLQLGHPLTIRDTDMQKGAKALFTQLMTDRLKKKSHLVDGLIPDFPPVCKRLTPGPGYLEALTEDNVEVIREKIDHVSSTGIVTEDGKHREVDAIACATGFDTTYRNRFPVIGINGQTFQDRWNQYPETYVSLSVDGFPNYFMSLGPNSAMGAGNLILIMEYLVDYAGKALAKMQTENILTIQPSKRSVHNFVAYCHEYFKGTVYSLECSSWYKGGKSTGPVVALWPGSSIQSAKVLENPRWEDWEYTYVDGNEFGWFGDGWSEMDRNDTLDRTFYLAGKVNIVDEPLKEHERLDHEEVDHIEEIVDDAIKSNDASGGDFQTNGHEAALVA